MRELGLIIMVVIMIALYLITNKKRLADKKLKKESKETKVEK